MPDRTRVLAVGAAVVLGAASLFAASSVARADPDDPYDSGCIQTAYIANSVGLFDKYGNRLMTIQNWYSTGCHTNWGLAYNYAVYSSNIAALYNPGIGEQCYPVSCNLGVGIPSPMWTDMVPGEKTITVCGDAIARSDRLGYGACVSA